MADGSGEIPGDDLGDTGGDVGPVIFSFDVVVVGAGTSGIAAAIQASRLGASVALLEETDVVGGQIVAAGVTSLDGGGAPPVLSGIYREYRERVRAHYAAIGKSASTCYWSGPDWSTSSEPRVSQEILLDLLSEADVSLVLRTRVVATTKDGDRVTGVVTADGTMYQAWIVIDATEYGDVIPLTGARYRVGNWRSDQPPDTDACIQDITYVAVIRKYPTAVPASLLFTAAPPGYDEVQGDFAKFVAPVVMEPDTFPWTWPYHNGYRGMPDSASPGSYFGADMELITRTGVNAANDFPGYTMHCDGGVRVRLVDAAGNTHELRGWPAKASTAWRTLSMDVEAFAGQNVTLIIEHDDNASGTAGKERYIDNVAVQPNGSNDQFATGADGWELAAAGGASDLAAFVNSQGNPPGAIMLDGHDAEGSLDATANAWMTKSMSLPADATALTVDTLCVGNGTVCAGQNHGVLGIDFIEDLSFRRQLICDAKMLTLQFLYYVQTDLGEPMWSVADDEIYDAAYNQQENDCPLIPAELKAIEHKLPVIPYVRESRRIEAADMWTGKDIYRAVDGARPETLCPTAVSVGEYCSDLHNCRDEATLEADLGETASDFSHQGPFQIPFESFIPEVIDGFMPAEKNLGFTRLVSGAARMQPSTMLIGQAAGAIAGLAVASHVMPRTIRPIDVQWQLVNAGASISSYVFNDVPLGHPQWAAVQLVSTHGVMVGVDAYTFAVDASATRAVAAVVLVKVFDIPLEPLPPDPQHTFADVSRQDFAWAEIEAFYREGLTAGCGDDPLRFCPDDPVTREQLAVFLTKAADLVLPTPSSSPFSDMDLLDPLLPYAVAATDAGLMPLCDAGSFCPTDVVTRGVLAESAAAVLCR